MKEKKILSSVLIRDTIKMEFVMKLSKNDLDLIELKNKVGELLDSHSFNYLEKILKNNNNKFKKGKRINEMSKVW